ncbi:MAG: hypothetical protein ACQEXQ_16245 [Bacillota bacterium]
MNPGVCKNETLQYILNLTTLLTYCWNDEEFFLKDVEAKRLVDEAIGLLCQAAEVLESKMSNREKEGLRNDEN